MSLILLLETFSESLVPTSVIMWTTATLLRRTSTANEALGGGARAACTATNTLALPDRLFLQFVFHA